MTDTPNITAEQRIQVIREERDALVAEIATYGDDDLTAGAQLATNFFNDRIRALGGEITASDEQPPGWAGRP